MDLESRQRLFESPTSEFRGKPFWAWNGDLKEEELRHQIDIFEEMGFGGYFMHSRTGLETEYLGEDWFNLINSCSDYGFEKGLESWLYDEDRWPSGSAGGLVTKNEEFRSQYLEMYRCKANDISNSFARENIIAIFRCYEKDGLLYDKEKISLDEIDSLPAAEEVLVFAKRYSVANDNYNGYTYLNTIKKEAVEKFIQVTHEQYKLHGGSRIGKEIAGIFTDEPHRGACFTEFSEGNNYSVPYTDDLFEQFLERFHYELKDFLPELFLQNYNDKISKVTRDYYELTQELFLERFAKPIHDWCQQNGLKLTGHVLHEDSLTSQATMQGSLMRFYEYMDIPGVDILSEGNRCYWTVKQVESVARQLGKETVLSELYGCTGWQMNFQSYKEVGDWQALFGINLRCPHLSMYTMKGESKRDYPASIASQSGWYNNYNYVEDYFSRIHVALSEGKAPCRLLVINPIESVWARSYSGAFDGLTPLDNGIQRLEEEYVTTFHALAENQIDFDYGEEAIMAAHAFVENGKLVLGESSYDSILISGVETLRQSTLDLLNKFQTEGGSITFAGSLPTHVDVLPSNDYVILAEKSKVIPCTKASIGAAFSSVQQVKINSNENNKIFVQSKKINGGIMIILLNMDRDEALCNVEINMGQGENIEQWCPRSGKVTISDYIRQNKDLIVTLDFAPGEEKLFCLTDQKRKLAGQSEKIYDKEIDLGDSFEYELSEPNVCVLDYVSIEVAGNEIISENEVLKADRMLRDSMGLKYRGGEMIQPWYEKEYLKSSLSKEQLITAVYKLNLGTLPSNVSLAVELDQKVKSITVNGIVLELSKTDRWIDNCFNRISIPDSVWQLGEVRIEVSMEYNVLSGIESIYLLGNFGVYIENDRQVSIGKIKDNLLIGDITAQGLPFYSGSISYLLETPIHEPVKVALNQMNGALVKLVEEKDNKDSIIAFAPYENTASSLRGIEVVLTRRNTFGPFHQIPKLAGSYGPENFITTGNQWTDKYQFIEQGLLEKPKLYLNK